MRSSNPRQRLSEINKAIVDLDGQIRELCESQNVLELERNKTLADLLDNEKLLAGSKWKDSFNWVSQGGSLALTYQGQADDSLMGPLGTAVNSSSYSSYLLEPEVELVFSSQVELTFPNIKTMLSFVNRHQLVIDGTQTVMQLHKLQREIRDLELIVHQLGLKEQDNNG
jgi:hypothetical protein